MAHRETTQEVMDCLHEVFKLETSGIIRYLHYSFMIMGHHRIPIQKWFRAQAQETMDHSITIGEAITSYGGHPPALAGNVEETNVHSVNQMLEECMNYEQQAIDLYKKLLKLAEQTEDIALEEMAREFIRDETEHTDEVKKMLRFEK